jgi:hypothetical protein
MNLERAPTQPIPVYDVDGTFITAMYDSQSILLHLLASVQLSCRAACMLSLDYAHRGHLRLLHMVGKKRVTLIEL